VGDRHDQVVADVAGRVDLGAAQACVLASLICVRRHSVVTRPALVPASRSVPDRQALTVSLEFM
jgi:hypothetical protein